MGYGGQSKPLTFKAGTKKVLPLRVEVDYPEGGLPDPEPFFVLTEDEKEQVRYWGGWYENRPAPEWPKRSLKGSRMNNIALNLVLGRTRVTRPNARLTYLGRAHLGQVDVGAAAAQAYYDLILPILNSKCTEEGVNAQKCAEYQLRLSQCQQKLSNGISQLNAGNPLAPITLADAAFCMQKLYDDVKDALEPATPKPPPPPMPPPPPAETGIPWWGWALGAVGIIGVGSGIYFATRK